MLVIDGRKLKRSLVIALLLILATPVIVLAATLVIDGQFGDWSGQPHVSDPPGDGLTPNIDILTFYWGNNPNDEHIYWMMEREPPQGGNARAYYFVFLDTNNDGNYTGSQDRLIQVLYNPRKDDSEVTVTVFTGTGSQISQSSGDWGESRGEGGGRAEWRVSFADLGIDAHQTVSMYAGGGPNADPDNIDRIPDSGDITWSPIPILGWPWLTVIVAVVVGVAWYTHGRFKWRRSSPSE
ncbi:MAG: hypothetical protein SVX38_00610 [Chloroflexota bacterium]|nr:hypothetical protein [Chloroflexota bacterium]